MGFRHNGIVMMDLEGRITFANTFVCDLMGVTPEEVAGVSCFEFVFPEDLESASSLLEENKVPQAKPFRFRLRRKNGLPVWVDIQGAPIKTASGPVFGVLATISPIADGNGDRELSN
jgi:PAS domain S-box-containing protein